MGYDVLTNQDFTLEQKPTQVAARLDYTAIAPAGIKALGSVYGYVVQSGLPRLLVNLVYLRVSQINGCAYCIDMHSRDLIKEGLAVEKLVLSRRGARLAACLTHANAPLLPGPKPSLASPTPLCRTPTSRPLRPCSPRRNWPI
jgi:AhpD family alkylhydroperoxidase